MRSALHRPATVLLLVGLGATTVPATAAPFIHSDVSAFAENWVTATDQSIALDNPGSYTSVAGELVAVTATAIGCAADNNSLCAVVPGEDLQIGGATARARTDYGSNRVYVRSNHYDVGGTVSHVDSASASSTWIDEWTLGGNLAAPRDFTVSLRADGSWAGQGAFALQVLLVNTLLGTNLGDDGLPTGTVAQAIMTNACGWNGGGGALGGCGASPLPPGFPPLPGYVFVDVNPDGDDSGRFDDLLQLSAPWISGLTYQVIVRLTAGTAAQDGSLLDAESTARVTQVLIPAGGTLTSSAGALANYNVTNVPVPAVGWILGAAITGLGWWRRRRASPDLPAAAITDRPGSTCAGPCDHS